MQEQLARRLEELKKEFETGQARLRELETEQAYTRETMLRISGAIQVLEEALGLETKPDDVVATGTEAAEKASGQTS
jgi:predicted nuclease with TOPRIM domain